MRLKHLLWILAFFCSFANADPMDKFVESFQEQDKVVEWVSSTTKGKVGTAEAMSIVSNAYANSFSKKLNPRLVVAIMKIESNFRSKVTSRAGAKGIMQVMPKFHKDKLQGRNPYLNNVSTEVGTTILQDCMDKHNGNLKRALSCYSGGSKTYHAKALKFQFEIAQSLKPSGEVLASNP